jgi:hypothetical protein
MDSSFDWIEIVGVSSAVTIEECKINARDIAIHLEQVTGPITIQNNEYISGGGINIFDCSGPATVQKNSISCDVPHRRGALVVSDTPTPVITDNTILGVQTKALDLTDTGTHMLTNNRIGGVPAIDVSYNSRVHADANPMIMGEVWLSGGARLRLTNNTFSSAGIFDDYSDPGLLNDPMLHNEGLDPNNIWTKIDWDGNGCCDYPPWRNVPGPDGKCECEGTTPPN